MTSSGNVLKPKSRLFRHSIICVTLLFAVTIAVSYSICKLNPYCYAGLFNSAKILILKDYYGLIGQHLNPDQEYYFERRPAVFITNYPQHPPVTAEIIETQEYVIIEQVRQNQKVDRTIVYRRERAPYDIPAHSNIADLVENGDYFFSVDENNSIGHRISIDHALREPRYIKISLFLQKIKSSELVTRIMEGHNTYTYWSSTGHLKENIGHRIENGRRKDWRVCYAGSDGHRAPCPAQPNTP